MVTYIDYITCFKRSFEDWFQTTFGSSFEIDFEGIDFDSVELSEWLQLSLIKMTSQYHRQVSTGYYGGTLNVLANVNIFVRETITSAADRIYVIRDTLYASMKENTTVAIYNYLGDSSLIDYAKSREIVDDKTIPKFNVDDPMQYNFSAIYTLLEKY